jgi:hypothetical protein
MIEVEWPVCEDAKEMHGCLRSQFKTGHRKRGRRKLRLFGCACARRLWDAMIEPRSRRAVESAEQFADGEVDVNHLEAMREAARLALHDIEVSGWAVKTAGERERHQRQVRAAMTAFMVVSSPPDSGAYADENMRRTLGEGDTTAHQIWRSELRELSRLLRDIFGNPFRPVTVDPAWLTSTVVQLAGGIYADRAFDRLPIMADALQDAGCDEAEILGHCRGPGPHVRGCWVVDLVLGKA